MKPATAVHTALQHIDSHHTGIHRIRVLPHGSLDDRVPWVAGGKIQSLGISKQTICSVCQGGAGSRRCCEPQSEMNKVFSLGFN